MEVDRTCDVKTNFYDTATLRSIGWIMRNGRSRKRVIIRHMVIDTWILRQR